MGPVVGAELALSAKAFVGMHEWVRSAHPHGADDELHRTLG